MLQFREIELNDKDIIEKYLKLYDFVTCYYSFASIYFWKDYYKLEMAIYSNTLYIKSNFDNEIKFYYPLGKDHLDSQLEILKEYTKGIGVELKFVFLEEEMKNKLEEKANFDFKEIEERFNYIYSAEELSKLEGKKFKQKRNFVNSFKTENLLEYSYQDIDSNKKDEYFSFLEKWYKENEDYSESLQSEKQAIIEAINNFEYLELYGIALYIHNEVVALTIGSVNNSILDTHFEKALSSIRGSYQMINYLFANKMVDKVKLINREEDLGHPGLRKAKMSYNPVMMAINYDATHIED